MKKLNETTITTKELTSYVRAKSIVINNELGMIPTITFIRERINMDGEAVHSRDGVGEIAIAFSADGMIDLVNPATLEPIGKQVSHAELQLAIYSLYKALVTVPEVVVPEEPIEPTPEPEEPVVEEPVVPEEEIVNP